MARTATVNVIYDHFLAPLRSLLERGFAGRCPVYWRGDVRPGSLEWLEVSLVPSETDTPVEGGRMAGARVRRYSARIDYVRRLGGKVGGALLQERTARVEELFAYLLAASDPSESTYIWHDGAVGGIAYSAETEDDFEDVDGQRVQTHSRASVPFSATVSYLS